MKGILVPCIVLAAMFAGCATPEPATPAQDDGGAEAHAAALSLQVSYAPEFPRQGQAVAFEASPTGGEPPYTFDWDFGDRSSTIARPMHTFERTGDNPVSLQIASADGQVVEWDDIVFVTASSGSGQDPEPRPGPQPDPDEDDPEPAPPTATQPEPKDPRQQIQDGRVRALYDKIQEAIATDGTVAITATQIAGLLGYDAWGGERTFQVRLEPSSIVNEDTWSEVDGQPYEMPFVEVYEGHVDGDDDGLVRLVLSPWWARGSIREGDTSYAIRINFDGNAPHGAGSRPMQTNSSSKPFSPEPSGCQSGLAAWAPLYAEPVIALGRADLEPITTRVILDGDGPLVDTLGADTWATLVAQLAEVDSIYDHEIAVRFEIAGIHLHTGNVYPEPDDTDPFDHMQAYWKDRHAGEWDIIHLVTGHDSGYAMANCIGGAGTPGGMTFTPYPWELRYEVFHVNAYAHEFGHIFDAHHHYGNHAEANLATIMIQGYTPGYDPNFSSLSKASMRGWAEQYLA